MSESWNIVTFAERPDLAEHASETTRSAWPEFMFHDPVANRYWERLERCFPEYQFLILDSESSEIMGVGNSIPFFWDREPEALPDGGWDWLMEYGCTAPEDGPVPNMASALAIAFRPEFRSRGLSSEAVKMMRRIARGHGIQSMVAPVRPNLKPLYPLTPMERYVQWTDSSGLPFDPWMRVHARLGACVLKVCPQSMRITGTVAEWESWAKMRFPESGEYVVPGALTTVHIDREADLGLYLEPNVWMLHTL